MRIAMSFLVLFLVSCASEPETADVNDSCERALAASKNYSDDYHNDSLAAAQYYDSVASSLTSNDWVVFDSIPSENVWLWRTYDGGNNLSVQLRYEMKGELHTILITDSLLGYMHDSFRNHLQLVQLNGIGSDELVVSLGGYYSSSAWGEYTSYGSEADYVYVYDLDESKLIWHDATAIESYQYCGAKSDSDCADVEYGYDCCIHFSPGTMVIDSVRYSGNTKESDLDFPPGRYQWNHGTFTRASRQP